MSMRLISGGCVTNHNCSAEFVKDLTVPFPPIHPLKYKSLRSSTPIKGIQWFPPLLSIQEQSICVSRSPTVPSYLSTTCNAKDALCVSVEGGGKDDIHWDSSTAQTHGRFHVTHVQIAVLGDHKQQSIFSGHLKRKNQHVTHKQQSKQCFSMMDVLDTYPSAVRPPSSIFFSRVVVESRFSRALQTILNIKKSKH